jgi:Protein of unknown function (DUF3237)
VRAQLETDDGVYIYARYEGLLEANDAVMAAITPAGETDFAYPLAGRW